MVVVDSLRPVPGALRRNPVLLVPTFAIALLNLPWLLVQPVDPVVSSGLSMGQWGLLVFVFPFFQGGLLGMADEGLAGTTGLGTFIEWGRRFYLSLLVGYILLISGSIAVGVGAGVGSFVMVAAFFGGGRGVGPAVLVGVGLLLVAVLLAFLTVVFFVQFYAQAVALEDRGAVDGFKRSAGLVRRNLLPAFGYSVVVGFVSGPVGLGYGAASLLLSPRSLLALDLPTFSPAGVALVALVLTVVATVLGSFFWVYSVAFYRAIQPPDGDDSPTAVGRELG